MHKILRITRALVLTLTLTLVGCATVDPLEPVNRKIFCFNMALDHVIFRPIARAYDTVVPARVACGIGNFFDNIDDVTNVANNVLQLKFYDAWSDVWRIAFNSTIGVFGLFDVATCAGLPKHHQDFGLTLARYGYAHSIYLMVPLFGPTTIRDSIGWTVDWRYLSVWPYIEPNSLRYGLYGLRLVHKRALLLAADKLIDESLDPYVFVRDAYLQKRDCEVKVVWPYECNDSKAATTSKDAPASDKGDTFVADDNDAKGGKASDDPFVSEDDDKKGDVKGKKTQSVPTKGGDPFVEP
jgi:phospholipid-binding lipoprotein MlaA